jgi:hypothetical protein
LIQAISARRAKTVTIRLTDYISMGFAVPQRKKSSFALYMWLCVWTFANGMTSELGVVCPADSRQLDIPTNKASWRRHISRVGNTMLLELAIGDAYGAGLEYADELVSQYNNLAGYMQHPRHGTAPGQYTDDTQMSIAVAEAIVSGEPWTPKLLADALVRAFRRDPRDGNARG